MIFVYQNIYLFCQLISSICSQYIINRSANVTIDFLEVFEYNNVEL